MNLSKDRKQFINSSQEKWWNDQGVGCYRLAAGNWRLAAVGWLRVMGFRCPE